MNLEKIYQQTILEYSRRKELNREIENPTFAERGHNPNCGDDLTLEIKTDESGVITDAAFYWKRMCHFNGFYGYAD